MATYNGTSGNDTYLGTLQDDLINGNAGNDILAGNNGDDTINGGDGDDTIDGGIGIDTLDGGDGYDTADYTTAVGAATYNLDPVVGSAALGGYSEGLKNFESILIGNGNSYVYGNASNNNIRGGAGADSLYGLAGDDTIFGGAGADYIVGDAGDDTIQGGLGQDYLDGGDGDDLVDYTTFNNFGTYNLGAGTANLGVFTETMLSFERIKVGNGGSTIAGTSGDNSIFGGAGIDTIDGGDGNDTIDGGAGNDTIQGGAGNDYIIGGLGQDTLDGGIGIDYVDYTTFGGNGNYNLATGSAILAGAFTEQMLNFENITTGNGNNTITGTSGENSIFGGNGNDTIDGDAGNDTIYGGGGNDTIQGGLGTDYLNGGEGNDTIQGGLGQDYLDGGAGNDTADYTTFGGFGTYDLGAVTVGAGTAVLTGAFTETMLNFENIRVGNGGSTVIGSTGNNYVYGGDGADAIQGGAGEDNLAGGAGNDTIDGGDNDDKLYGDAGNDTVFSTSGYISGGNKDIINGGDGIDTINYYNFGSLNNVKANTFDLETGSVQFYYLFGIEEVDTILNFENIYLGNYDIRDLIYGSSADNNIRSGGGEDTIYGGAGNDTIEGGLLAKVYGEAGNDILSGNNRGEFHYGSLDILFQPPISNTNTLATLLGTDTIKDFNNGYDKIVLHQNTLTGITDINGALKFAVVATDAVADTSAAAIVYSQATRTLFYNQNGILPGYENGGAFAVFANSVYFQGDLAVVNFIVAA